MNGAGGWFRTSAAALAFGLVGCAGAAPSRTGVDARFAQPEARRAAQLAPDLYARADRARRAALDARGAGARADHALRARLLLKAALAEADRIDDERAADRADERAERAALLRAALENERQQAEQRIALDESAARARLHAAAVFTESAAAEPGSNAERARFLRERARVLLAAAVARGLPEARAAAVQARIAQAEQAQGLAAAQGALAQAERALGQARAADGESAAPEACRALLEMARERGFVPELAERGVALPLAFAFAENSAQPSVRGARVLSQLAALAFAHPLGAIEIEGFAAADRIAGARAERIARSLHETREAGRLRVAARGPIAERLGAPVVVFTAYRAPAPDP